MLSHYPILMWNGQHKGSILLYGHTHQTVEDAFFQECIRTMNEREDILHEGEPKIHAINVGCLIRKWTLKIQKWTFDRNYYHFLVRFQQRQ